MAALLGGAQSPRQPLRFADVAEAAGLRTRLLHAPSPEKHLVETMPGGVAAADFDGDGKVDLFFANGADPVTLRKGPGQENRLYRNLGGMRFADITAEAGVAGAGYDMAAAAADYDNDGDIDLFVAGVHRSTLYRNRGAGRFEDATAAAGIGTGGWAVGAGWFDIEGDGDLDLFVVHYLVWRPELDGFCGDKARGFRSYCHPSLYRPAANALYRNNGNGTFTDVSAESGIGRHPGKGMAVAFGDADGDGRLDVFVTNDTLPNFLFRNEARGLRETGLESGVAFNDDGRALSSMGAAFRDYDQDGRDDILITALANETFPLFRNLGKGLFRDMTRAANLGRLSLDRSGWSCAIADFDNDGLADIFTANGDVQDNSELFSSRKARQSNSLWLGRERGFADASEAAGLTRKAQHRGAAIADFDADGRLDLVVTALGEAPSLLWNRGPAAHWIGLRLEGRRSNRQGLGARVRLTDTSGRVQTALITQAMGYASSIEPIAHFGLGAVAGATAIEIQWPSGALQRIAKPAIDAYLTVAEP